MKSLTGIIIPNEGDGFAGKPTCEFINLRITSCEYGQIFAIKSIEIQILLVWPVFFVLRNVPVFGVIPRR